MFEPDAAHLIQLATAAIAFATVKKLHLTVSAYIFDCGSLRVGSRKKYIRESRKSDRQCAFLFTNLISAENIRKLHKWEPNQVTVKNDNGCDAVRAFRSKPEELSPYICLRLTRDFTLSLEHHSELPSQSPAVSYNSRK
ncbi:MULTISPECIES: hypothetical protein [Bradyrhizobium]|uniref:hypothetical protein n=1 Tax=Bradyrhizobium TaxID=374 RepID=UPI00211E6398|nr:MULTISPECIES: hypothetical protein [Bradyrhizobium]